MYVSVCNLFGVCVQFCFVCDFLFGACVFVLCVRVNFVLCVYVCVQFFVMCVQFSFCCAYACVFFGACVFFCVWTQF